MTWVLFGLGLIEIIAIMVCSCVIATYLGYMKNDLVREIVAARQELKSTVEIESIGTRNEVDIRSGNILARLNGNDYPSCVLESNDCETGTDGFEEAFAPLEDDGK